MVERSQLFPIETTFDPNFASMYAEMVDKATTRRCGDCHLCCTALEVFDLPSGEPKPLGCRCPNMLHDGKCSIYESRPMTCRLFYCSWRLSEFLHFGVRASMKPERCGFVLHYDRRRSFIMTLFPDPKRPKEWVKWKKALEKLARNNNCAVVIGGGNEATHYVTPKGTWVSRADFPHYFDTPQGIGVPTTEFIGGKPGVPPTFDQPR